MFFWGVGFRESTIVILKYGWFPNKKCTPDNTKDIEGFVTKEKKHGRQEICLHIVNNIPYELIVHTAV
ncbi:hypothetical protein ED28_11265 [[Pantoea] beijingensis]|uniref:Uncharacterized protein n=1 Tax=[Pantoea] beijingensis TaxID=1324864 RepID=A0A443IDD0_9GAMM|nr:hypothetical protein ED28_11265 [[Pantoea] beijingensis]